MRRALKILPRPLEPCPIARVSLQRVHSWASEDEAEWNRRPSATTHQHGGLDFSNHDDAYRGHSSMEMLKSLAILRMCRSSRLVHNADRWIETSRAVLGDHVTHSIIRRSFFQQFCPGTNGQEALEKMRRLSAHGIGCMFDWVPTAEPPSSTTLSAFQEAVDANMKTIARSIECAAEEGQMRMAAIKLATITSLGTLHRVSDLIRQIPSTSVLLFICELCGTRVSADEGSEGHRHPHFIHELDRHLTLGIDTPIAPLSHADREELQRLKERLASLASYASKKRVRLLIDAEESEIQPAIDYVVLCIMDMFNKSGPWVWNTYQCYLQDARSRLLTDMEYMRSNGRAFGVKLVRGAYLRHETEQAIKHSRPSRVFNKQQDTDNSYNQCMRILIDGIHAGRSLSLCLATHNQPSIETALRHMDALSMKGNDVPVCFAQLYGMRDYLTYTLGHHHYQALKLLVFGDVHHVIPYLLRRAQENSDVLGGSQRDTDAMKRVLLTRIRRLTSHRDSK